MSSLTTLWYLEFRRAHFTPWQALKIARRITTYSPAEVLAMIGGNDYDYLIRSARP